jgi:hypothetical protein
VFPKELRHPLHARFEEHGQVRSDLHPMTFSTKGYHETAKVGIELRRPARKIDKLTTRSFAGLKDQFHDRPFHHLFSPRRCSQVAVVALLVTLEAQIHLQRLDLLTLQSVTALCGDLFFKIVHRPPLNRLPRQFFMSFNSLM